MPDLLAVKKEETNKLSQLHSDLNELIETKEYIKSSLKKIRSDYRNVGYKKEDYEKDVEYKEYKKQLDELNSIEKIINPK